MRKLLLLPYTSQSYIKTSYTLDFKIFQLHYYVKERAHPVCLYIISVRSGSRHGMLRSARSTGNLIDISSPPSLNEKEAAIKHHRRDSPSLESEKNDSDSYDRKFYPSNKASKSYTSTVSSKIKKQNLSISNNNISTNTLLSMNRCCLS